MHPSKQDTVVTEKPGSLQFFLNGRSVSIPNASPDLLLIDYLRSPDVALAGPKKPCGQGGCGGCTVILSQWDSAANRAEHRAINSCLRPVVAVNGMVVTTIEGTGAVRKPNAPNLAHAQISSRQGAPIGAAPPPTLLEAQEEIAAKRLQVLQSAEQAVETNRRGAGLSIRLRESVPDTPSAMSHEGMNPVAWELAMNNGTQCGYCTVGFVMNMSDFITANPKATKREIEDALDGNLCRCTGYRSILTGMKKFASDWTPGDDEDQIKCLPDPDDESQRPAPDIVIPFPRAARHPPTGANFGIGRRQWLSPATMKDLVAQMRAHRGQAMRLVQANTGFGIYKEQYLADDILINIGQIHELHASPVIGKDGISVPAGISYTALIDLLSKVLSSRGETIPGPDDQPIHTALTRLGALDFMARRTAGRIVRNAATLGGNTMLMLAHIASGTGAPFPSDLATAMLAVDARVDYIDVRTDGSETTRFADLIERCTEDPSLPAALILVRFHLPYGDKESDLLLPQKIALREVNAHSIVNNTSLLVMGDDLIVRDCVLAFGGIAPFPWRPSETEAAMRGKALVLSDAPAYVAILQKEIRAELNRWAPRVAELPTEGFTDEYKIQLALAFFYKSIVNALNTRNAPVPPKIASTGDITWGRWPISTGKQFYEPQDWKRPVALPYIKITAMEQASGQLHYTQELQVPPTTVNGSLVQSKRALANWHFRTPDADQPVDADALRDKLRELFAGFVDLVTEANLPDGGINLQGMGADQPVFAPPDKVDYVGQSLALVAAHTEEQAAAIALFVTDHCVGYSPIKPSPGQPDWWGKPVLSLRQAIEVGSIYPDWPSTAPWYSHIWKVTRPGSRFDWAQLGRDPLDTRSFTKKGSVGNTPCMIVGNTQSVGGQVHFYMESQAAIAEPLDGRRMLMRPSTQSPMEMHQSTAMALGVQYNSIEVQVPPVGGGFGGKTEQARFVIAAAAVAARAMKLPVRLVLTREQDTAMIGKRHAYYGQYQVAIGTGEQGPGDKGTIYGLWNRMWGDGGAFYDCSFIVSNCIQTRADNAYMVRNFENQIDVCRTNTAPSTAFRSFGDIQGKLITENAIDDAAFSIGMRPEDVREKNLYQRGDVTPFGQALSYCYMRQVWDYLKEKSRFEVRCQAVEKFNSENRWRKRGIAMLPVKYGSGYNATMLEQAAAMISIYANDGSIVIHQGGVEMGQGLLTQIRQVAAYILNMPLDMIEIVAPRTAVMPNPSSTGGSTGTAYNAEAVKRLCGQMRTRLIEFANDQLAEEGPEACKSAGIDFWNYPDAGWKTKVTTPGGTKMIWQNLITLAYQKRIPLTASFSAPIRGGETQAPALTFKPFDEQPHLPGYTSIQGGPGEFNNFVGFTYSGACSTVEVDILTGETKILSSDIVYDMGWSLNQALDIGQVEGAFVQGIGYVMTEKLVFEPEGEEAGRLNTLNTWTYKVPASASIPLELNTYLFPRDKVPEVPPDPTGGILSSKEVGEPPLVLAASVFFAIKSAIRASRLDRDLGGLFRLDAPATVQEISRACEVTAKDFTAWI